MPLIFLSKLFVAELLFVSSTQKKNTLHTKNLNNRTNYSFVGKYFKRTKIAQVYAHQTFVDVDETLAATKFEEFIHLFVLYRICACVA